MRQMSHAVMSSTSPARDEQAKENSERPRKERHDSIQLEHAGRHHVTSDREKPRTIRVWERLFDDWWSWEILSWLFSFVIVLVIIFILRIYDQRPLTDWSGSITINTTVALLTTVAKLGFVAANSAALGQLRWNWYSKPHLLSDLKGFDDASRGSPWGSVQLLLKLHVRHLASTGAVISLAAIFFSSLTQQALTFPSRYVPSGSARMPRGYSYVRDARQRYTIDTIDANFVSPTDSEMLAAVAFTAYNGSQKISPSFALEPECVSGNCTFESYTSLAACSECTLVNDQVTTTCVGDACYYTLLINQTASSNDTLVTGSHYNSTAGLPIYTSLNVTSTNYHNRPLTIVNMSALYTDYTITSDTPSTIERGATTAVSCGIFMCVKTFNSSITNGTLSETVQSTHYINASTLTQSDGVYKASISAAGLPGNATLAISQDSLDVFGQNLAFLYAGSAVIGPGYHSGDGVPTYAFGYTSTTLQSLFNNGSVDVEQAIANIATVITNVIRQQSDPTQHFAGTSHSQETFLAVRWAWIAYPAGLEAVVLLFLLATIFKTGRSGVQSVWKSSPIALLFHGLENRGEALKNVSEISKLSEMTELSSQIRVQLAIQGPGTTLVDAKTQS